MSITLNRKDIASLTDRVESAQLNAKPIPKLTDEYPAMTLADAYAVQLELRRRWLAQGRRQVGWKAGLTSKAKMLQMGVDVPAIGFLLEDTERDENVPVPTEDLIHPRVECEVAFVTKSPLAGADCTREDVLAATAYVLPAIEIIDSRFSGFKFDLPSVVADNSSSARYVAGSRKLQPSELNLCALKVVMEKNGEVAATGTSAAVMGHPADAVALLVKVLHELGEQLPAGSFVMSGGITEAIAVKPDDQIVARYDDLGSVSVRFA